MITDSALRALGGLFAPSIRTVFWKVIGLTLLALAALWLAVREAFFAWVMPFVSGFIPDLPDWAGWLTFVAAFLSAIGLAAALAMLIAPVSAVVAGFFLDDAADIIEKQDYPGDAPGTALPLGQSLRSSLRFFLVVVLANLVSLLFLLVPGVNLIVFFVVNGYLLGREYFEFAASRHLGIEGARAYRRAHRGTVTLAGFVVALFLFVPFLNLLTPLFAAVMMIHLFKAVRQKELAVRTPARAIP